MDTYDENQYCEMPVDSSTAAEKEKKKDIDEAMSVGSQFSKYYYEMMEKKPHLVGQLYLEDSLMLWDGNPTCSRDLIQKFIETQLPPLTFSVASMDCQSLNSAAVGDKKSIIITTSGLYLVSGVGTHNRMPFTQRIIITTDDKKWRIAVDNFRSQNSNKSM